MRRAEAAIRGKAETIADRRPTRVDILMAYPGARRHPRQQVPNLLRRMFREELRKWRREQSFGDALPASLPASRSTHARSSSLLLTSKQDVLSQTMQCHGHTNPKNVRLFIHSSNMATYSNEERIAYLFGREDDEQAR